MKRQFGLLLVACIPLFGLAQVVERTKIIGGTISLNNTRGSGDAESPKSRAFALGPNYGIAIRENTVIGISSSFNYSWYRWDDNGSQAYYGGDSKGFDLAPYIQKFYPLGEKLYFSPQFMVHFISAKSTMNSYLELDSFDKRQSKEFTFQLQLAPNMHYFLSDKWAISANFGSIHYARHKSKTRFDGEPKGVSYKEDEFDISLASTVNFSIRLFLTPDQTQ